MKIDASSEEQAQRALDEMLEAERAELLEPVRVVSLGDDATGIDVALGVGAASGAVEWTLELREEGGRVHRADGRATPADDGRVHVSLRAWPETGYHQLHATVHTTAGARVAEQSLIVAPPAFPLAEEVLKGRRVLESRPTSTPFAARGIGESATSAIS